MRAKSDVESPIAADEVNLRAGAKLYSTHCAVCHDPVGEIFWKAKNGIRLTGMPGFVKGLSDTEL